MRDFHNNTFLTKPSVTMLRKLETNMQYPNRDSFSKGNNFLPVVYRTGNKKKDTIFCEIYNGFPLLTDICYLSALNCHY